MSHHLDSPEARSDARLNITDYYVFPGQTGTVFAIDVNPSIAGPDAPMGFHPEGKYEFRIDGDGDLIPELIYRLTFGERGDAGQQSVELRRLTGADIDDELAAGTLLAQGVTGTTITTEDGLKLWAGPAHDPFFLDADVLHAVGDAFAAGTRVDLSNWTPATAKNAPFASNNLNAIVLEVPDEDLRAIAPEGRINSWALSSLATDAGGWHPINRVGLPMIPPLFAQHDGDLGDRLNHADPTDDHKLFGEHFAQAVAAVVGAYGTAADPLAYGRTVAEKLLPNVLPYTIGTPAVLGFASWNGRSLTDSAPDVMFSLATNTALTTAVTMDSVPFKPTTTFPYVPVIG
jgi:hypothetical protein